MLFRSAIIKNGFFLRRFSPVPKKFFRFNALAAPYALTEYKTARRIQKPKNESGGLFSSVVRKKARA